MQDRQSVVPMSEFESREAPPTHERREETGAPDGVIVKGPFQQKQYLKAVEWPIMTAPSLASKALTWYDPKSTTII